MISPTAPLASRTIIRSRQSYHTLEALAARGAIPISTARQRANNKLTAGSTYGVPRALSEALNYGYLSPNLEAPAGYRWTCRAQTWTLAPRGG